MTDIADKQIVVWETSAINNLANISNCDDLIARMEIAYTHWVPMQVFDEIAATQCSKRRDHLLRVCRRLTGNSDWSLISPGALILEAIQEFSTSGKIDWNELMKADPKFEQAIASGAVFDDDLASVQKPQMQGHLNQVEGFFAQQKTQLESIFTSGSGRPDTLDEFIKRTRSDGLIPREIRRTCECILGHDVDLQFAEKFSKAFPPIMAQTYAFLIAHYRRSGLSLKKKSAGAFDLYASMYLPLCHKYVSEDRDQLAIFREVVKYYPLLVEVIWFSGDFRRRFTN